MVWLSVVGDGDGDAGWMVVSVDGMGWDGMGWGGMGWVDAWDGWMHGMGWDGWLS